MMFAETLEAFKPVIPMPLVPLPWAVLPLGQTDVIALNQVCCRVIAGDGNAVAGVSGNEIAIGGGGAADEVVVSAAGDDQAVGSIGDAACAVSAEAKVIAFDGVGGGAWALDEDSIGGIAGDDIFCGKIGSADGEGAAADGVAGRAVDIDADAAVGGCAGGGVVGSNPIGIDVVIAVGGKLDAIEAKAVDGQPADGAVAGGDDQAGFAGAGGAAVDLDKG